MSPAALSPGRPIRAGPKRLQHAAQPHQIGKLALGLRRAGRRLRADDRRNRARWNAAAAPQLRAADARRRSRWSVRFRADRHAGTRSVQAGGAWHPSRCRRAHPQAGHKRVPTRTSAQQPDQFARQGLRHALDSDKPRLEPKPIRRESRGPMRRHLSPPSSPGLCKRTLQRFVSAQLHSLMRPDTISS